VTIDKSFPMGTIQNPLPYDPSRKSCKERAQLKTEKQKYGKEMRSKFPNFTRKADFYRNKSTLVAI